MPSFDTYFCYPDAMKNQAKLQVFRDFVIAKARNWSFLLLTLRDWLCDHQTCAQLFLHGCTCKDRCLFVEQFQRTYIIISWAHSSSHWRPASVPLWRFSLNGLIFQSKLSRIILIRLRGF